MFEDFFTTYSMVDPPKIYKDNPYIIIEDIKKPSTAEYLQMDQVINNPANDVDYYYGIVSPFQSPIEPSRKETPPQNTSLNNEPKKVLKGPSAFEQVLDEAEKINPEVKQFRNFLVKTAKRESGFNSYIQNKAGAPYYGYFQMGKEEIRRTTGLSIEQFRNNPVQQILGAVKLYKINLKTIKAIGIYNLGKEKGYSDDALVAGAWMGGPGGVKKYLLGLGDPSDSHWYKNGKGGSSVGKIMNNWKEHE